MKEELYQWVRNMAVFYILFTAILNLVPDKKYEKYVRFFMGLLLIFMMSTPIFSLFGKGQELTGNFQVYLSRENKAKEEKELENLQKAYLEKGYETELGKKIQETLQKKGIEIQGVKVNIEGEQIQVVVITGENVTQEQKGRTLWQIRRSSVLAVPDITEPRPSGKTTRTGRSPCTVNTVILPTIPC